MRFTRFTLLALALWASASCSKSERQPQPDLLIVGSEKLVQSTTAGNLISTAIKEAYDLDIVFYPSRFISKEKGAILSQSATPFERDRLLEFYPGGAKDKFITGTMTGKDIREFIYNRASESYELDLEVAGLEYDIGFIGGYPQYFNVNREYGLKLEDDRRYRVGISEYFYFSGDTFPAYKYRNGISSSFAESQRGVSARDALSLYLNRHEEYLGLEQLRARVTKTTIGDAGFQRIHNIQGPAHRSPIFGQTVTTEGIVTAAGSVSWYPGGTDIYIQDPEPDADDRTSESIYIHLDDHQTQYVKLGDRIRVSGTVYERLYNHGLGKTGILQVTELKVLSQGNPLPAPVVLGLGGREIPKDKISTFNGDLNFKPSLNLNDGIDFWESLEGMRVQIENPRVTAFRGGLEQFIDRGPKSYLSLYLVPNGDVDDTRRTPAGGIHIDAKNHVFNPQIMQIQTNHLTAPIATDTIFRTGDLIPGKIVGVLGYEANIFGDGEYALVLPERQPALMNFISFARSDQPRLGDGTANMDVRPKTSLVGSETALTVATFNVKNLSGNTPNRAAKVSDAISVNLRCPDILTLPEIQDANGPDFSNGSSGEETLEVIVKRTRCPFKYEILNIDPVHNDEGGQPGGNIRIAILYNPQKLDFQSRPPPNSLTDAVIDRDGNLNYNPGRVSANDQVFTHTRRSIVAQFTFRGRSVFVIGNHFNSKLGDQSLWSSIQPAIFESEDKRSLLADRINDFVELLARRAPQAAVFVMGDFNAYISENAMGVLEGTHLKNLMTIDSLIPVRDRYTINYNGSGQAIDFIFASKNLLGWQPQLEVLHLNTSFMGQISDHDPVISRFEFP